MHTSGKSGFFTHPNIAIVEDDLWYCRLLSEQLVRRGCTVSITHNGEELFSLIGKRSFDCVVLDYRLQDECGIDICRKLRVLSDVPILILTGLKDKDTIIAALSVGADDYVVKPHDPDELRARIDALIRRCASRKETLTPIEITLGTCQFDPTQRTLMHPGGYCKLSTGEAALLEILLQHHPHAVSREQASLAIFGRKWQPTDRNIDLLVSKLRRILKDNAPFITIDTVRSHGYALNSRSPTEGTHACAESSNHR